MLTFDTRLITRFIVATLCTLSIHGQVKDVFDLGCGTDYGCWLDDNFKVTWQPYKFRVYSMIGQYVKELKWTNDNNEIAKEFAINTTSVQILFGLSTDLRKELPFEVTQCTLEWNYVEQKAQVEHFHLNGYQQVEFHQKLVEEKEQEWNMYVNDPVWMLYNKTFSQEQGFELPFEVTQCTLEWNYVEQKAQVEHFHLNGYQQVEFHQKLVEEKEQEWNMYVNDPVWMLYNKTFSQEQGFVGCYYDRAWDMKFSNKSDDYLDLTKPYYLSIYVRSPLVHNNSLLHLATTSKRVYLTQIEVLSQGLDMPPFIDAHALMMVLAWGFLIPFGVAILKFLRYTSIYEMEVRGFSLLLIIHALVNTSGLILTIVAGVYMIFMTGGITVGLHAIFGTIVVCLCIVQCLLGLVHFVTYTSMKLYWIHRCLGGILVFSSLLNIFLGIRRVVVSGASENLYVFYMFLAGIVAVGYVAFEVYQCTTNRVMGSTPFWLLVFYVLILILLLVLFGIEFLSEFLGGIN
ncbi:uncharacterized protein LOC142350957 [Convolutriloba macropyga]|uniref:uncharacterized protein LOC142350957 n=1 Tax=Convolutriloba macropyga TaxID=536237 RepID=UPI003F527044